MTISSMKRVYPVFTTNTRMSSVRQPSVARCLFGAPDPKETERMYRETLAGTHDYITQRYTIIGVRGEDAPAEKIKVIHDESTSPPPAPVVVQRTSSSLNKNGKRQMMITGNYNYFYTFSFAILVRILIE